MAPIGEIVIISGDRGSGKTTFCAQVVEAARQSGWQVCGLITPACVENGDKTAIEVVDLQSGEHRLLAWRRQAQQEGIHTPHWTFDPTQLVLGDQILANSLPCDLFVVDELGPLEFLRGEGWLAGLAALDSGKFKLALVVIRPELLEAARSRWLEARVVFLEPAESAFSLADAFWQEYAL